MGALFKARLTERACCSACYYRLALIAVKPIFTAATVQMDDEVTEELLSSLVLVSHLVSYTIRMRMTNSVSHHSPSC